MDTLILDLTEPPYFYFDLSPFGIFLCIYGNLFRITEELIYEKMHSFEQSSIIKVVKDFLLTI